MKETTSRSWAAQSVRVAETNKTVKPGLQLSPSAKRFSVRGPAVGDPETSETPKMVQDEFVGEVPDVKYL